MRTVLALSPNTELPNVTAPVGLIDHDMSSTKPLALIPAVITRLESQSHGGHAHITEGAGTARGSFTDKCRTIGFIRDHLHVG
jgi:hypothetical protein